MFITLPKFQQSPKFVQKLSIRVVKRDPLVSHYLSHLYDIHKTISAIITTKNIQADWDGDTIMTRITDDPVVGP